MLYNVTDQFTKLAETAGTIQNVSNIFSVEVSDKAEPNSGFLLFPLNKISVASTQLYVRCVDGTAEVRVVPFVDNSGSVASSGGASSAGNVATDEQIDDLLDDIFPLP